MSQPVETPCMAICRTENGVCIGCGRTTEEIEKWLDYTDNERKIIMKKLESSFDDLDLF